MKQSIVSEVTKIYSKAQHKIVWLVEYVDLKTGELILERECETENQAQWFAGQAFH